MNGKPNYPRRDGGSCPICVYVGSFGSVDLYFHDDKERRKLNVLAQDEEDSDACICPDYAEWERELHMHANVDAARRSFAIRAAYHYLADELDFPGKDVS